MQTSNERSGAGPSVYIETHGCKLNSADSQSLVRRFSDAGYVIAAAGDAANVFVLNTCTVTHVADRKARQALGRAKRQMPEALIVATGCMAERISNDVASLSSVDMVVTNRDKNHLVDLVSERVGKTTPCADGRPLSQSQYLLGRSRSFIKIQEGCNQVCAYCIVPRVRGRERSIPEVDLVDQVRHVVGLGCLEVVLTGTQLGSYGFDLKSSNLVSMVKRILAETEVQRLRVSSLQPAEITTDLIALWTGLGNGRLCPHFHIPLQSGSNRILARMRRRYSQGQYLGAVERIRSMVPDASITADVISGFPGEKDSDHEDTLNVMARVGLADVHVFPYSARPGTSAAHFKEQVPTPVRIARAAEARALGERASKEFRKSMIGQKRSVLWEGTNWESGLTDNYVKVQRIGLPLNAMPSWGKIETVTLEAQRGNFLLGRVAHCEVTPPIQ